MSALLFPAGMVKAILQGRKTQTRRLVRTPELRWASGDEIWVRESWRTEELVEAETAPDGKVYPEGLDGVRFAADGAFVPIENTREAFEGWIEAHAKKRSRDGFRPSIHMPKWAARIRLRVTSARREHLQLITRADAVAEGTGGLIHFQRLWDELNGKRAPWAENPLVDVIEFEVISK